MQKQVQNKKNQFSSLFSHHHFLSYDLYRKVCVKYVEVVLSVRYARLRDSLSYKYFDNTELINFIRQQQEKCHIRIQHQLKKISEQKLIKCGGGPIENDIHHWRVWIEGPQGTPYAGGRFFLDVLFPKNYPFKPPKITFITKIFHPNISQKGDFSQTIADVLGKKWMPTMTVVTALKALKQVIVQPCEHSQEWDIGQIYRQDRAKFNATAEEWTKKYAQQQK